MKRLSQPLNFILLVHRDHVLIFHAKHNIYESSSYPFLKQYTSAYNYVYVYVHRMSTTKTLFT